MQASGAPRMPMHGASARQRASARLLASPRALDKTYMAEKQVLRGGDVAVQGRKLTAVPHTNHAAMQRRVQGPEGGGENGRAKEGSLA